jgi:hypothetical protein
MFLFPQFCKRIVDDFLLLLFSVCKKDGQKQTGRSGRFQEKGFKLYSQTVNLEQSRELSTD